VTKSFLEPLGINGFLNGTRILTEEFIDGIKPGSRLRSDDELAIIDDLTKKMIEFYEWDKNKLFLQKSSQKCSDMLIHVGKMKISYFLVSKCFFL
jgi:hypothetical protein